MSAGYGRSVWCVPGIGLVSGRFASGRVALAQSALRRLNTPRGTLRGGDEEDRFGIDLPGYVGAVGPELAAVTVPGLVRSELLKDDRIRGAAVRVVTAADGPDVSLTLDVTITPADSGDDFTLTLGVDSTSVSLIGGIDA